MLEIVETLLKAQLQAVDQLRARPPADARSPGDDGRVARRGKRMSQTDMAYQVLSRAGQPLHISAILREIQAAFGVALGRDTLVSALVKKAARGQQFVRTARNTFTTLPTQPS